MGSAIWQEQREHRETVSWPGRDLLLRVPYTLRHVKAGDPTRGPRWPWGLLLSARRTSGTGLHRTRYVLGQPVPVLTERDAVCTEHGTAPALERGWTGIPSESRLNNRSTFGNTATSRCLSFHGVQQDSLSTFLHHRTDRPVTAK